MTGAAQDALPECDHLTLDLMFYGNTAQPDTYYVVGNATDEPIANVKVVVKTERPAWDDEAFAHVYAGEDGLRVTRTGLGFDNFSYLGGWEHGEAWEPGWGGVWISGSNLTKDTLQHWLLPELPAGASADRRLERRQSVLEWTGFRRDTATLEHLASGTGEALCRTEQVFWIEGGIDGSHYYTVGLTPSYGIAGMSADDRFPAAGDTVNFKIAVAARGGFNVNASVRHTPGLELNLPSATSSPAVTPAPKSSRTLPLAVWQNYDAAKGEGDFYIGSEDLDERTETSDGYPPYEITLPLRLKSGAVLGEQCVTATVTGIPGTGAPNVPHVSSYHFNNRHGHEGTPYDDPSDNTATLCLGALPAAESPVLLRDGRADLLNLVGCANRTDYPCPATATTSVRLVIGGGDAAANAGQPYEYLQPEDVVVHVPDHAGRNIPGRDTIDKETSVFWWTGSDDEGPHSDNTHPGFLPGVVVYEHYECTSPDYDGWKLAIADITDGQGNTIDRTPGTMIIGSLINVNFRDRFYVRWPDKKEDGPYPFDLCQFSDLLAFEFDQLGTYKADITLGTTYQTGSPKPTYSDTARYTFHVGPIAELSVSDRGPVPALSPGQAAYTLNVANHGPDVAESAKVVVKLPAGATGVSTVPANLGTFLAAGTTGGVARANPYWIWDAGTTTPAASLRGAGRPQGRAVSLVVTGVTSGEATATVSNGNGDCTVSPGGATTTLAYVITEADCEKVANATWTLTNPYTVCIDTDSDQLADVTPKPAGQTACEATAGNKWYAGTVYDHRQGNNTATLKARAAGGAGLSGAAGSRTLPTVALNWPAASGAAEYRIFRSGDGSEGSYRRIASVDKNTLTYTDEDVAAGTTYHYRVEALRADYSLAASYAVSATATLTAAAPRAPGSLPSLAAARAANDDTVIGVSWTAPSNATAATRYDVQYQSRAGKSGPWGGWNGGAIEQAGTSYTLTGAGGGTGYRFRVRAVNVVGNDSYPGSWRSVTVSPLSNPNQVRNLQAGRAVNNETIISVGWDAPSGGTAPTGYDVEQQVNGGSWTSLAAKQAGTTYLLTGAAGGSSYRFRVRTVTDSGGDTIHGSWKNSNTVPRVSSPNQVGSLTATRETNDDTRIGVSWTAPSGGIVPTSYDVRHKRDGESWSDTATTTTASYTLEGASGASRYQFQVRPVRTLTTNERLEGSWRSSNTVPALPKPGQVGSLTATRDANDETEIDVSWTAPSNASGILTTYEVQHKRDGGAWSSDTATAAATSYTLTGALGGSRYQFQVRAVTTLTSGTRLEGSWRSSNTVRGLPAGPIASVTAKRSTTSPTTIDVRWSESARATSGYDVQYRKNNGSWRTASTKQTGRTHTQTDAGGVESYTFRVRGVSDAGNGAWTESATVAPPPVGYHGADVGPQVADGSHAWIKLKVTSGPWSFDYRNHVGDWSSCVRVASGSYTIKNLRAPITYLVDIYDDAGCSDADKITRAHVTTIDVPDQKLDGHSFNDHTHKRWHPAMGELGVKPSTCLTIEQHSHGWPDGGGGQHWHCPIYD